MDWFTKGPTIPWPGLLRADPEVVTCSAGCPVVIFKDEWAYHLRWHMEERYP